MHQGAHESLRFDDVVALRRAHPEHDVRLPSDARIVKIKQSMKLTARVAGTHAANLDVYGRSREASADFRGQRASAGGACCQVAGLEHAHQGVERVARRNAGEEVEVLDA